MIAQMANVNSNPKKDQEYNIVKKEERVLLWVIGYLV
jgi:hypothetical protein